MPRRALLTADQRARLFAIPVDPAEMARHYIFDKSDLARIRSKRRAVNQLGFAVRCACSAFRARGWDPALVFPSRFCCSSPISSGLIQLFSATMRAATKLAESMPSNFRRCYAFEVFAWPIGARPSR